MSALRTTATIRKGIAGLAIVLFSLLATLKFMGADQKLLLILISSAGLLVGLLLITYRAFAGVAETARNMPQPLPGDIDDEDER